MNIYEKLQKCRVELQKTKMKKSGKNTFSKYEYFELGDFLPRINELMLENGLTSVFAFNSEISSLTIIDTQKTEDCIEFSSPVAMAELKGCVPIQNIGATQTYMRRYLYVMAFEIVEHDVVNELPPQEPKEETTEDKTIDDLKLKSLLDRMKAAEVDEAIILESYQLDTLDQMTVSVFIKAMSRLEKTIANKPVKKPISDLGI